MLCAKFGSTYLENTLEVPFSRLVYTQERVGFSQGPSDRCLNQRPVCEFSFKALRSGIENRANGYIPTLSCPQIERLDNTVPEQVGHSLRLSTGASLTDSEDRRDHDP